MINLEKRYEEIFCFLLTLISVTIIFRRISTILIILFTLFNIIFIKRLKVDSTRLKLLLIVASPFILDILFLWNNQEISEGLKSMEKRLSLLIFPIFILGFNKKINLRKFLNIYTITTVSLLLILFIRYSILYSENLEKYLKGIHLWEMGYHFSSSFGMHAPALNMHISFVTASSLFLLLNRRTNLKTLHFYGIYGLLFLLSLFFLLYVNTRVAIVTSILSFLTVFFYRFKNNEMSTKKSIKVILVIFISIIIFLSVFVKIFPYSLQKFTSGSFSDMDKIGKLDEFENPEDEVYSKLVTRVSIWISAIELSENRIWIGHGASDAKGELVNYFKKTNQKFLARNEFPTHNQYIDFLLKFGILGLCVTIIFMVTIGWLGAKLKNPVIISFFIIFLISNLTDDFLIRYDGIAFSGLWFSIFANQFIYLKKKGFEEN
ncbi:O-antigen ligase family protein [Aquimarina sp. 2-A2]|uniref:O-antigen ligase family protein n=1 Tax=Aquimarina sp. 2-A2 TaxID=3382644 RepID=UPI00387F2539